MYTSNKKFNNLEDFYRQNSLNIITVNSYSKITDLKNKIKEDNSYLLNERLFLPRLRTHYFSKTGQIFMFGFYLDEYLLDLETLNETENLNKTGLQKLLSVIILVPKKHFTDINFEDYIQNLFLFSNIDITKNVNKKHLSKIYTQLWFETKNILYNTVD